jgi:hypothetical protein
MAINLKLTIVFFFSFVFLIQCLLGKSPLTWKPAKGPLLTEWGKNLNPGDVLKEYPRPQMVRKDWLNLNGLWQYAILPKDKKQPQHFHGQILVPFAVESALSGVGKKVGENNKLWYKREFEIPKKWNGKKVLLHFGAVDWQTTVWINGKSVGPHKGGYDAFYFDITNALKDGKQELVVSVWDPTNAGSQPRGKQVRDPRGIWYTSVTGIWQTVWLEPVNKAHIASFKLRANIDKKDVTITPQCENAPKEFRLKAVVKNGKNKKGEFTALLNDPIKITIQNPNLWSPENPFLYDLELSLLDENGETVDNINSYFGMRKISLGKDANGVTKMMLNNKDYFQLGPLDQGWWPDGLYTAPSDEALLFDVKMTKKLGFNMARKHVKIEPARWYYWCDKLGLLVWQDMPSGDKYIGKSDSDIQRSPGSAHQFEYELKKMVDGFYNHPSIVMWVPYSEGWGQWDTPRIVDLIKQWDPTRLVNNTSGWTDRGVGDVNDIHSYPGPDMPPLEENRAAVLGEFGGLGLPLDGHTWQEKDNWGYRNYKGANDLLLAYMDLMKKLEMLKDEGLSAAVYTQTTDVEIEVNGLMTYDRALVKMNPEFVRKINSGYLPPVFKADSDIFVKSLAVTIKPSRQNGEIRYTLDGSDPGIDSHLYKGPIQINNTTVIKARIFFPNGSTSLTAERLFSKATFKQPVKSDGLIPGLKYAYYETENKLDQLPDFSKLQVVQNGFATTIDLTPAKRNQNYALVFGGFIQVNVKGIFHFSTMSDDGSQLFIGKTLVVNNDFTHGFEEKTGHIALKAGHHPIKITFFQGVGDLGLRVMYKAPGSEKSEISPENLFHKN